MSIAIIFNGLIFFSFCFGVTILIDASQHRNAHHMDGRYAGDYFLSVYLMVGKGSSAGWVMVSDHGTSGPYSFSHVIGCRYGM